MENIANLADKNKYVAISDPKDIQFMT